MLVDQLKPLNILIIEDNRGDFIILRELVNSTNLPIENVFHADNMKKGKEIIESISPDLIFLDLHLPDSTGLETFTSVNTIASAVPIIVLSGLSDTVIALEAIAGGAQDYLMKGEFDNKILLKTILYSLERKANSLQLEESNKRYELVSMATNDPVWDLDLKNHQIYWNAAVNIFGYPEDMVKDEAWRISNIHPQDQKRVIEKHNEHLKNKTLHWTDEYQFRCGDGTYKYILDRAYILVDKDNNPYRMIGSMQDVTERKILEKKLAREQLLRQKQLTENTIQTQENERAELGKELHDNINQILATAKLFIEMAINDEGKRKEFMQRSRENIVNAIEEIRHLSKSLIPPSLGYIGLKETLTEMINNFNISRNEKIVLKTTGLKTHELTDSKKLMAYRIVQEQLTNVLKHAHASEVTVEINAAKNILYILVVDNGIGFDTTKSSNGVGLRNIASRAEAYNGFMEIISEPGKGCTLKVSVPLSS